MSYIRKTRDEYELQSNSGYGWDTECTEETLKDARSQRKCYRENCPNLPTRIIKHMVPIASKVAE
jgi:hypothetical protein